MKKVRRIRKEKGIAATVGTLFALMIFTTLLSVFTTQYVPVHMKTVEYQHVMYIIEKFSYLRSIIDILVLTQNTNFTSYLSIKLGTDSLPVLSSPTECRIALEPYTGENSSSFAFNLTFYQKGVTTPTHLVCGGELSFLAPNRYYVAETISLQNGAIIRYNWNAKNSSIVVGPHFIVKGNKSSVQIALVLQTIYGYPLSITGKETKGFQITLLGAEKSVAYIDEKRKNVTITLLERQEKLYFNKEVSKAYVKAIIDWIKSKASPYANLSISNNKITIYNVTSIEITKCYLKIEVTTM